MLVSMKTSASAVLWSFDDIELVCLQSIYSPTQEIEKVKYPYETFPLLQMCTKGLGDMKERNMATCNT